MEPKRRENRTRTKTRQWVFRIGTLLLAPVVFFAIMEAGLRLASYGHDTSLFLSSPAGGVRTNPEFSLRFFPPSMARTPLGLNVAMPKPPGTYRIVVLGESAAQGYPEPAFSMPRALEVLLEHDYPDADVEVVNLGITAINSHVIREVAREAADLEPDLFVVYAGNNEVVGPFGPGTVFAGFSPNLATIRAAMAVKRWRSAQWIGGMLKGLGNRGGSWKGMQMFVEKAVPEEDPRLPVVYEHFRENLNDVIDIARSADVPLVLSTVGANLRNCAPFVSQHRSALDPEHLDRWQRAFEAGCEAQAAGDCKNAIAHFRKAAAADDGHAETHYRLAQCLLAEGDRDGADQHFRRACDADALRFRPDRHINQAIRDLAARRGPDVRFVDGEAEFAAAGEHQIPGEDLFFEHVHMTFQGNYVLARALRQAVVEIRQSRDGPSPAAENPMTQEQVAERLGHTPFEEYTNFRHVSDKLIDNPPFTSQFDHAQQQVLIKRRLAALAERLNSDVVRQCELQLEQAVRGRPDDPDLRLVYARVLLATKQYPAAVAQLEAGLRQNPDHRGCIERMAGVLELMQRWDEANRYVRRIIDLSPVPALAFDEQIRFAGNLASGGKSQEALRQMNALLQEHHSDPDLAFQLNSHIAYVYLQQGDASSAIGHCRAAVAAKPNHLMARVNLAVSLLDTGDAAAAAAEAAQLKDRLPPADTQIATSLARIYSRMGNVAEARALFERAIKASPQQIQVRLDYCDFMASAGLVREATAFLRDLLNRHPNIPAGHSTLAKVLIQQGGYAEAAAALRRHLARSSDDLNAKLQLARLLAAAPDDRLRDGREALRLAQEVVAAQPGTPLGLDAMAMAHAEQGDYVRALEIQQRLAASVPGPEGRELRERLVSYQAKRPYRLPLRGVAR